MSTTEGTTMRFTWLRTAGTPDYHTADGWRAVYVRTEHGYGRFNIYRPDGSQYGTGGLPERVF